MIDADLVITTFQGRFKGFLNKAGENSIYLSPTPLNNSDIGKELMSRYTLLRSSSTPHSETSKKEGESFWARLAAWIIVDRQLSPEQLDDLSVLLAKKRVDYGCKNITGFGEIGIIVRAMDKVHRLENMAARGGETAVGEPVEDALNDIIGYAGVAYLFLTGNWMDDTIPVPPPEPIINFTPVSGLVFIGARGMHWMVNFMDDQTMVSLRVDNNGRTSALVPSVSGQKIGDVQFCLSHLPTRAYIFTRLLENGGSVDRPGALWCDTAMLMRIIEDNMGIKVVA